MREWSRSGSTPFVVDRPMLTIPTRRLDDENGASATEYGLLVVAIAAIIVIIVFALGGVVKDLFAGSCASVQASTNTSAKCG